MSESENNRRSRRQRFDSPQQEAYLNLWRTFDRLKIQEDTLFCRYKLTAQQYNTLRLLKAVHPEKMQTLELAGRLISRAPDITRLLDKLEEQGLVERERLAENRRVVEVSITPRGLALLAEMAEAVKACHQNQLGHLTEEELAQLVALLRRARNEPPESGWG